MMIDWQHSDLESVSKFHAVHYGEGTIESWSELIKRHAESAYNGKATYVSTYAFVVMIWHDDQFRPHAKCAVTAYSALKGKNDAIS